MLNFEPLHAQPERHHHHRRSQVRFAGQPVIGIGDHKMGDQNRQDLPADEFFTPSNPFLTPVKPEATAQEHGLPTRLALKLAKVTCHFSARKHSWTA